MNAATIAEALGGKRNGKGWKARCPAHDDHDPSLDIDVGENGKPLLKCRAGCDNGDIIKALKARNLWPKKGESIVYHHRTNEDDNDNEDGHSKFRRATSILRVALIAGQKPSQYPLQGRGIDIVPANARLLDANTMKELTGQDSPAMVQPVVDSDRLRGAHVTYLNRACTAKADDMENPRRFFGPVGGGWVQLSRIDSDRPPDTLIIGEGVESTLAAMQITGYPGIASMSASSMPAVRPPRCPEIIIAADNDENGAGQKAAEKLAERLRYEGQKVRIAIPSRPPGREGGYDWNDALLDGDGVQAWQAALLDYAGNTIDEPVVALTDTEFMALVFPKRELFLSPWLPRASLAMVHAQRGDCKTWFALAVGRAVAAKADFLGWECQNHGRVLYIDGELPGEFLQKRLGMFEQSPPRMFRIVSRDSYHLKRKMMPDLGEEAGRKQIDKIIDECQADVVILDSLSTLIRSGKENDGDDWTPIQDWLMQHRWLGRTMIMVHHQGKSGNQRGTSKREDVLDTIIKLSRPRDDDVTGKQDAESVFKLEFTKSRDFFGTDAAPMILRLSTTGNRAVWRHELERNMTLEKVRELISAGVTQKQIAKELNLSAPRISQMVKKLRETDNRVH